jgi:cobalt-precorrin 5A hydrolase
MERGLVIVAGFGIRAEATLASLHKALEACGNPALDALAVVEDKAHHPALAALAAQTGLGLCPVPLTEINRQGAQTLSPHQPSRYGPGSVAEAAALAIAGPKARLLVRKTVSTDGLVTIAIAEGTGK